MTCRNDCQYIFTNYGDFMCIFCGMHLMEDGPPSPPREMVGLAGLINTPLPSEITPDFFQSYVNTESRPLTKEMFMKAWEEAKNPVFKPRVHAVSQRDFDYLVKAGYINPDGTWRTKRTSQEAAIKADTNQGEQQSGK